MANVTYPYFIGSGRIGSNTVTGYSPFGFTNDNGDNTSSSDEMQSLLICSEACFVGGFKIKLNVIPGAGKSWQFTVRKNQIDTGLTLTISDTGLTAFDFTTILTFAQGDTISLKIVPTGTPDSSGLQFDAVILFNSASFMLMGCTSARLNGTLAGLFSGWWGGTGINFDRTSLYITAAEVSAGGGFPFPSTGILKNFYFQIDTPPGVGFGRTFKLHKNGAVQFSYVLGEADTLITDVTTVIPVATGDKIIFEGGRTGAFPPNTEARWSCSFASGTYDPVLLTFTSDGQTWMPLLSLSYSLTPSSPPTRTGILGLTELQDNGTDNIGKWNALGNVSLKNLYIYGGFDAPPGAGASITLALATGMQNVSSLSVTLSNTDTDANDITNQVAVPQDTYFYLRSSVSGSPAKPVILWGILLQWNGFDPFLICQDDGLNHRFRLDYILDTQRPAGDSLNDMLATFGGFLVYSGSKVKLMIEKIAPITQYFGDGSTTAANATFDPGNIVKDSFSWNMPSIDDRPNRLRVQWVDPDQNYVKVYTQVDDRIDQDDRNTIITRDVSLLGITRASQASRMAKFLMASMKYAAVNIEFSARLDSIHCEVGDVICVTQQSARFTRKLFRITNAQESDNEEIRFSCKEYNPSLYDDHVGAGPVQMIIPAFSNPYAVPPDPTNITLVEQGFQLNDGTHITNIAVSWTAVPADILLNLNYYLIQVSLDQGSTWGDAGVANSNSTSFIVTVGNAPNGTVVKVRVRAVTIKGVISPGNNTASITLLGNVSPPSDVLSLSGVFSVDHVALSWNPIADADLFGYEVRQGDVNSVWETGSVVVTGYGGTNYNIFNVPAATKKYCIKAIDRSGNYSSGAACTSVTATSPVGSVVVFEFDLFSRITDFPHPLFGSISSGLNLVPTTDYNPAYYRMTIQPKTINTWLSLQVNYATWLAIQNSGVRFGFDPFITTQENYTTEIIDLLVSTTGTFILETQAYSSNSQGSMIAQWATSADGITFSSFVNFIAGTYTTRYAKFKFLIQAKISTAIIRLIYAKLTVTSP
jgi:hypothetical protein